MNAGALRVVGVDPSVKATGIASSDGWVKVIGRPKLLGLPLAQRVDMLDELAVAVIDEIKAADLVVIEEPISGTSRARTTSGVERNALYWLLVRWLVRHEVSFAAVNNSHRAMYATGNGNSGKTAVVDAVADFWPGWDIGRNDNKADAVALMALGRHALGYPVGEVPPLNARAIERVAWPFEPVKVKTVAVRAKKINGVRVPASLTRDVRSSVVVCDVAPQGEQASEPTPF